MPAWVEGMTYAYLGEALTCLHRFFVGSVEYVELARPNCATAGQPSTPASFVRTALALAPCVTPKVTVTLGGIMRHDACGALGHPYRHVIAHAGPHAGSVCCTGCGGPIAEQLTIFGESME